jgi:glycosyltransferase involved in cell wall biosynthesis
MRFEGRARFNIITPTLGRDSLRACVLSVAAQSLSDHRHIVIGDGKLEPWARELLSSGGCHWAELPRRMGAWGAHARNRALAMSESTFPSDYTLFLDDDNVLFPCALENLGAAAEKAGNPPLLYQRIVHFRRWDNGWWCLPTEMPPKKGFWDTLNGCYRSDIIRGLRWNLEYEHDFYFSQMAIQAAGTDQFACAGDMPGGLHY